jgi:hypothetical protein
MPTSVRRIDDTQVRKENRPDSIARTEGREIMRVIAIEEHFNVEEVLTAPEQGVRQESPS